ncbi:hypothetical protein [Lactobacillus kalixensis]|uniref:Uncharacterized protein n=1 Tax=Lactobacillus kalixensis DSM 16043 TaxID=1423763 RepID=A0A0R1UH19_9LACO|nr:hypothetical protein [Lactobacillus kalixensis]KRL88683.1 hypothetical protein FC46_GL001436 [Lactobacillus kalixensis DSM 16043]
MYEIKKQFDELIDNLSIYQKEMLEDAKTIGTYRKDIQYVKEFKYNFDSSYNATPEEQVMAAFNTMIENTTKKLRDAALDEKSTKED